MTITETRKTDIETMTHEIDTADDGHQIDAFQAGVLGLQGGNGLADLRLPLRLRAAAGRRPAQHREHDVIWRCGAIRAR